MNALLALMFFAGLSAQASPERPCSAAAGPIPPLSIATEFLSDAYEDDQWLLEGWRYVVIEVGAR